ncbi:MAG: hypothetical protein JWM59_2532 [Verrucomicrobiales bacterium]|nr:hypothetical protein [Verrucomicrobiales bacterium]
MIAKFVSESKIEDLIDGPFDEFGDSTPERPGGKNGGRKYTFYLSKISHDEESEGADDSPGFLLQDDHDHTKTMGMEFNDPGLMSREAVSGLSAVLNRTAPDFQVVITVFPEENMESTMEFIILKKDVAYISKQKTIKRIFS